jgi:hypothetical protein
VAVHLKPVRSGKFAGQGGRTRFRREGAIRRRDILGVGAREEVRHPLLPRGVRRRGPHREAVRLLRQRQGALHPVARARESGEIPRGPHAHDRDRAARSGRARIPWRRRKRRRADGHSHAARVLRRGPHRGHPHSAHAPRQTQRGRVLGRVVSALSGDARLARGDVPGPEGRRQRGGFRGGVRGAKHPRAGGRDETALPHRHGLTRSGAALRGHRERAHAVRLRRGGKDVEVFYGAPPDLHEKVSKALAAAAR